MSESINDEQQVSIIRQRIVDTAQRMLKGSLSGIEGARILASLRHEAAVREDDPDFMVFVAIASETDDFPADAARQYWSTEALEKLDPTYHQAEKWALDYGKKACESLVHRFIA